MGQALSNIHGIHVDSVQGLPISHIPLTWQTPADHQYRVTMIYRLLGIVHTRMGAFGECRQEAMEFLPDIARHLELALYRRAASLSEYLDQQTLTKRLQFLALTAYPPCGNEFPQLSLDVEATTDSSSHPSQAVKTVEVIVPPVESKTNESSSRKRKLICDTQSSPITDWIPPPHQGCSTNNNRRHKRMRRAGGELSRKPFWVTPTSSCEASTQQQLLLLQSPRVEATPRAALRPESVFMLNNNPDIIRHIYSFLEGSDAIRHTSVNRFAAQVLPSCVQHLNLKPRQLCKLFASTVEIKGHLDNFPSLRNLSIVGDESSLSQALETEDSAARIPQLGFLTANYDRGVRNLLAALSAGACPRLESLSICSVFFDCQTSGVVSLLMATLKSKACPELRTLRLIGNGVSDAAICEMADALMGDACGQLEVLDLRRNYIGESGVAAICKAIEHGKLSKVSKLLLGGNVIGCSAVSRLAATLSRGYCPDLRTLSLDGNFILRSGAKYLVKAMMSKSFPALTHLHVCDNLGTDAFALYFSKLLLHGTCRSMQYLALGSLTNASANYMRQALAHLRTPVTIDFQSPVMVMASE